MAKRLGIRVITVAALACLLSLTALFSWALTPVYDDELLAADTAVEEDHLGLAVALDDSIALVGAPDDNINGTDAGAVFVFYRDGYGDWHQEAKLTATESSPENDHFGFAVAVDSLSAGQQVAVIGAPRANTNAGRAYVFERVYNPEYGENEWHQTATLRASDETLGDQFGSSVAIDLTSDTILVGAQDDAIDLKEGQGSAYFFRASTLVESATPQSEQAKLVSSDGGINDHFGYSVAVSGDVIMVGAPFDNNDLGANAGAVYLYSRSLLSTPQRELVKLLGSSVNGDDHFGYSIAISGDTAMIGAPGSELATIGLNVGRVYVFEGSGASWSEEDAIENPDFPDCLGDHFGNAVAIEGDRAVLAAYLDDYGAAAELNAGTAYLFLRDGAGDTWREHAQMVDAQDTDRQLDEYGYAVALSGDYVVVGSPNDDEKGVESGAAYVYRLVIVDDDHDGVEDTIDNCPSAPNGSLLGTCIPEPGGRDWAPSGAACHDPGDCIPGEACSKNQEDFDGDGSGDVCDDNVDGDLYSNAGDFCPWLDTLTNWDSDGDRVGDDCDLCYDIPGPFDLEYLERNNWTAEGCSGCLDDDGDEYYDGCDAYDTIEWDCNDEEFLVHPGAAEECNGDDDDCDGLIDENAGPTYYQDRDDDGYSDGATKRSCSGPPPNYKPASELIATSGDCWDIDPDIHPGATEICNGWDDDCDGEIDEGLATLYYRDQDHDGYSDGDYQIICEGQEPEPSYRPAEELIALSGDCDDSRDWIHPDAPEECNGEDDDCDDEVDEGLYRAYYWDGDDDGYANAEDLMMACENSDPEWKLESELISLAGDCNHNDPNNWVSCGTCYDHDYDGYYTNCDRYHTILGPDCDDSRQEVNPGATETCNNWDDDCDGLTDEGLLWWDDQDEDGYGNPQAKTCYQSGDRVQNDLDCDDEDPQVHPGATEVCNYRDDDCDEVTDEGVAWFWDGDGDGYGTPDQSTCYPDEEHVFNDLDCDDENPEVNPDAEEICNDVDDDCDGAVDEEVCNEPPVAVCQDVEVSVDSKQDGCEADVSIDNGSYDPDDDPISSVAQPAPPYEVGVHLVTLTVSDAEESDDCSATVTVTSQDPVCVPEPAPTLLGLAALGSLAWLRSRAGGIRRADSAHPRRP